MDEPHILVVEDEGHLADGIRYNLVEEGHRVTVARDGSSALELLTADPDGFDLVVLDLMLPGMSGYSVCEALREAGGDVPVLILSARTLVEDRIRGFDVGADQYMTKPFELDEFLSRVRSLLALRSMRRHETPPATTCEFGEARVDFDTYEVVVRGEPTRLTALEMKLFRHFVENPDRVISREELIREVWEMRGNPQTRAPDQFMSRLRKIFEADPSHPQHFLTVRDAGYRFVPEPEDQSQTTS